MRDIVGKEDKKVENIYKEDEKYYRLPIDEKNKNEDEVLLVDSDWVGLGRIKLRSDGTRVFDPIYVPENLADDILNGNIDPERYTREELRRMSLKKQQIQSSLEEYDTRKFEYEETKKYSKYDYNVENNFKKM